MLQYEKARLRMAGKDGLAARVEHVAETVGSGEGFDVRSFEESGKDRLIEVKTTVSGKEAPFFLTRNELGVSRSRSRHYHLYRLFRFRRDPRMFMLDGALDKLCLLEPTNYLARVG